jgi:predicted aspartyl protease
MLEATSHGASLITQSDQNGYIFLLREHRDDIILEKISIGYGETKVFMQPDYLTFILPLSAGQSSDLLQKTARKNEIMVSNQSGKIGVTIKQPDGRERTFPAQAMEDLVGYDIRVNISGANGFKKALIIRSYETVEQDDGPVIDLFGGMIPMQPGDYSITLEVSERKIIPKLNGSIPLLFDQGLLLIEGRTHNDIQGYFIVDFGAGSSVVAEAYLSENTNIIPVKAIEYSEKGERVLKGTMGAVGGDVDQFLGNASLNQLRLGNLSFNNHTVRVIRNMPEFGKRKIIGIIGMDILKQADLVRFNYSVDEDSPSFLRFESGKSSKSDAEMYSIPFSTVSKHIFVDGHINGNPISFLFDTGARGSIISRAAARAAGLHVSPVSRIFRGLDGAEISTEITEGIRLQLGSVEFKDVDLYVADLPFLSGIGLDDAGGIVGNDFLKRFSEIMVNFEESTICFLP